MPDVSQLYSADLTVSNNGDLAISDLTQLGQERVIRRLMTSQGDYIFQLDYGAGLPAYLGNPIQAQQIEGVIRDQMLLETAVSQNPLPSVSLIVNGDTVTANITYVDGDTDETSLLSVPINDPSVTQSST
jgi:hypothetical protein